MLDAFGGAPVTKAPQGLPAPPRPGGRLLPRAHGEPPERRGHLRLPAVPTRGRGGGAAAARGAAERFPRRGQPDTCLVISHANRMRLNEQHPKSGARGGGDAALRGAGRGGHQRPSDDAGLAGLEAPTYRWRSSKCGLEVSHRCTRPCSVRPWQLA